MQSHFDFAFSPEPKEHSSPWFLRRAAVSGDEEKMRTLASTLPLVSEELLIAGRRIPTPRLVSFHGDDNAAYRYSGRVFRPSPWTAELLSLRAEITRVVEAELDRAIVFNSVLVNYYRDGRDAMGYHSDNERELGPSSPTDIVVASLSLGAHRQFVLREKKTRALDKLELGGGDLLVMFGDCQQRFEHAVPRTAKIATPRMNLTFRVICPQP